MKILILSTGTINCEPIIGSLYAIKKPEWDICIHDFFKDPDIVSACVRFEPDKIVYLSVSGGPHLPPIEKLKLLNGFADSIHLCFDASCPDWHPLLHQYHHEKVFDLTVNIDGNDCWPFSYEGITTLAPIDPRPYEKYKNEPKIIDCGFCGGWESPGRREIIDYLKEHNLITVRSMIESQFTYDEYARFMSQCKMVINMNQSGGGGQQVKARVIETGLAGCLLFEPKHSIAQKWFRPEVDYIPYESKEDLLDKIKYCNESTIARCAENLHMAVMVDYSPKKFWGRVLEGPMANK